MSPTVYRCLDADGRLLYVGMTEQPRRRLRVHELTKSWWPKVGLITLEEYRTREEAAAAEREAILGEAPAFNIIRLARLRRVREGRQRRYPRRPRLRPDEVEVSPEWEVKA